MADDRHADLGVVEVDRLAELTWLKQRFVEEGVWIRPFGNVIYTTPPLIISEDELALLTSVMVRVIRDWGLHRRQVA